LGRLTGAAYLDVFADTLINDGDILSNGSAYIEVASLLNGTDGVVQASFLDVSVSNPLVNEGVVMGIYALGLLTPSIDNRGAIIAGAQGVATDLELSLESLTNTGLVQATGALSLTVDDFITTAGAIQAGGSLVIDTGALSVLTEGSIRTQGQADITVAGLLSLGAGVYDENGETNGATISVCLSGPN
jgi:adhesin HecA-like repeat protein